MEACTHIVQYNGLCAVCGTLIESQGLNTINMGYDTVNLTVSRSEAERLESENAKKLLKDRKLSLILDLDQTILHASCDPIYNSSDDNIKQFTLEDSPIVYYIKLRPGLIEFLKEIEPLYELHIYTMGTRLYAEAVTKLIDSDGNFFKERILSRDESGSVTQKKLQRLFPCDTSMVVVIDDRSDVWNYSPNLIRIKPFEYFVGIGDINSKEEKTIIENKVTGEGNTTENNMVKDDTITKNNHNSDPDSIDEEKEKETVSTKREQDNELHIIQEILKKIHTIFYTQNPQTSDVTRIIPLLKKKILENIVIVFADVIPPTTKNPTLSWIWQMATSFGAMCSTDLTGKTTHLIAVKSGRKVKAARLYGHSIHVVTPAWLLDSTARWAIQDENLYELSSDITNNTNNINNNKDDTDYSESTSLDDEEEEESRDGDDIEKEKLNEEIDWSEADREVEDFINESGIDDVWDTDSDTKSGMSNVTTASAAIAAAAAAAANFRRKKKRRRQTEDESGGESGGDDESEVDDEKKLIRAAAPKQKSLLEIRRAKTKRRGKSHLSKVTTVVSGNSSDNELNSDLSSLDDFAGVLDNAID